MKIKTDSELIEEQIFLKQEIKRLKENPELKMFQKRLYKITRLLSARRSLLKKSKNAK